MKLSYGESQLSAKNLESVLGRVSRGYRGGGFRGGRGRWGEQKYRFGCFCQALAFSLPEDTSAHATLMFCASCVP